MDPAAAAQLQHRGVVVLESLDGLGRVVAPAVQEGSHLTIDYGADVLAGDGLVGLQRMGHGQNLDPVRLQQGPRGVIPVGQALLDLVAQTGAQ